jgi:hypothetical protein
MNATYTVDRTDPAERNLARAGKTIGALRRAAAVTIDNDREMPTGAAVDNYGRATAKGALMSE